MLFRAVLIVSLCVAVQSDYVIKKYCRNVVPTLCSIHQVMVEPCLHGPQFCSFIRGKPYGIKVDFTPNFSAENLRLEISGDHLNSDSYDVIKTTKRVCDDLLVCPLEASVRHNFELSLSMDIPSPGKFPVQVKLWNEDDESQACCFTFHAKVK
ncbi:MD-2-related lipid-recognition protein-like [Ostrinia nubilalis]|uniref:MD-2-related lipid-recognition protein-like n=1 Tax=Ostrinia nubilalis TaxID=29057 RepID=UPI0030822D93